MNHFDRGARLVVHFAREESAQLGHTMVGPEHLLLGLLREGGGGARVLHELGLSLEGARRRVVALIGVGAGLPRGEVAALTPSARLVMAFALSEARALGSRLVTTEHLLLGLLRGGDGLVFRVLQRAGVAPSELRRRLKLSGAAAGMPEERLLAPLYFRAAPEAAPPPATATRGGGGCWGAGRGTCCGGVRGCCSEPNGARAAMLLGC